MRVVASPGACQARKSADSAFGNLARRKIEAAIIAPIYDEMRHRIGEENVRDILRRAIRRAAIDAGTDSGDRRCSP